MEGLPASGALSRELAEDRQANGAHEAQVDRFLVAEAPAKRQQCALVERHCRLGNFWDDLIDWKKCFPLIVMMSHVVYRV